MLRLLSGILALLLVVVCWGRLPSFSVQRRAVAGLINQPVNWTTSFVLLIRASIRLPPVVTSNLTKISQGVFFFSGVILPVTVQNINSTARLLVVPVTQSMGATESPKRDGGDDRIG